MQRLPAAYRLRTPQPADAPAVAELRRAAEHALYGTPETTLEEVVEEWALPRLTPASDLWLIETSTRELAGYGFFWAKSPPHDAYAGQWVHPRHHGRGLTEILLSLGEARAAGYARHTGTTLSLSVSGDARDEARLELFAHHGFRPVRTFLRMELGLGSPPPAPSRPAGIDVRTFRRHADERAVHDAELEAFRDHFRPTTHTVEEWRRMRFSRADLDTGLWFVAWDGAEVAGSALSFALPDGGYVEDLSVRRPWRGRGLGRALLLRSFAALRERGLPGVSLDVDSINPTGALHLYESMGMRVVRDEVCLIRDFAPAGTPG